MRLKVIFLPLKLTASSYLPDPSVCVHPAAAPDLTHVGKLSSFLFHFLLVSPRACSWWDANPASGNDKSRGEFAFSGISVFILQRFSCFCRSSVYRSTYQGTSTDQVKHLNEALSSFFCVSVNELDRENHSWNLWDLITVIKMKLQRGEGQKIVSWVMLQLLISQLRPLLAEHRDSVSYTTVFHQAKVVNDVKRIKWNQKLYNGKCWVCFLLASVLHQSKADKDFKSHLCPISDAVVNLWRHQDYFLLQTEPEETDMPDLGSITHWTSCTLMSVD